MFGIRTYINEDYKLLQSCEFIDYLTGETDTYLKFYRVRFNIVTPSVFHVVPENIYEDLNYLIQAQQFIDDLFSRVNKSTCTFISTELFTALNHSLLSPNWDYFLI